MSGYFLQQDFTELVINKRTENTLLLKSQNLTIYQKERLIFVFSQQAIGQKVTFN